MPATVPLALLRTGPAVALHVNTAIQTKSHALGFKQATLFLITTARRQ